MTEASRTAKKRRRSDEALRGIRRRRRLRAAGFYGEGRCARWPAEFDDLPPHVQAALEVFVRRLYGWMGRTDAYKDAVDSQRAFERMMGWYPDAPEPEEGVKQPER